MSGDVVRSTALAPPLGEGGCVNDCMLGYKPMWQGRASQGAEHGEHNGWANLHVWRTHVQLMVTVLPVVLRLGGIGLWRTVVWTQGHRNTAAKQAGTTMAMTARGRSAESAQWQCWHAAGVACLRCWCDHRWGCFYSYLDNANPSAAGPFEPLCGLVLWLTVCSPYAMHPHTANCARVLVFC